MFRPHSLLHRTRLATALCAALLAAPRASLGQTPCGVYVATTGTDVAGCGGLPGSPCRTIAFAQSQAISRGLACVMLRAGTYVEAVTLAPGLHVRGGFDVNWNEGAPAIAAYRATIVGGLHGSTGQYLVVYANALASPSKISALYLQAPNATGSTASGARSSHGLVAVGSNVTLENVTIVGGSGASGLIGANGSSASPLTATTAMKGGDGGDAGQPPVTFCDDTQRGAAGVAGTNAAVGSAATGGAGGPGGTMDTNCGAFGCLDGNCTARSGTAGADATVVSTGVFGDGGSGGSGSTSCGPATGGLPGRVSDGAGGTGGLSQGAFVGSFWYARAGGDGTLGLNGTGGGGGGGSGGCDSGTDSWGAGGGGGGAGGLRAPTAGAGGGGGGGSYGVLAVSSTVTVTNCTFLRGAGGAGGRGGNGGNGQAGGAGGSGGLAAGSARAGGAGGDGGRGGHSGAGGGGAGGDSYGILSRLSTVTQSGNTFSGGSGGGGGAGGTGGSTGSNGSIGATGAVGTIRVAVLAAELASAAPVLPAGATAFDACHPLDCLLDAPADGPAITALLGVSPNPMRARGTMRFALARESHVRAQVLDVRGAVVRTLADERWPAGEHVLAIGTRDRGPALRAGLYFVRFAADGVEDTRRLIVIE